MNHRLTIAAAVAVILASISEIALISGGAWLVEAAGAVAVVALAGTATRLAPVPAAIVATVLGALGTSALLAAQSPYWKGAGAVVIACCAASASRIRLFRPFAGLVTYLAALLLYLNALYAGTRSLIRIIPTAASLHLLRSLASQGAASSKLMPPVDGTHGVLLLAAASIGLAAITVDFVAVRLRKPAIAGLPLLVLFIAPIATTAHPGGMRGAITFVLAAMGYLALLSSDGRSRLRGWGRVVTVWHYSGEDERVGGADVGTLAATGRRIGLAAVCAAIVVPLLLPTLSLRKIIPGGPGGSHVVPLQLPDPVQQLHGLLARTPREVLSYRSNAPDPGNYLQVFVLNYDSGQGSWDVISPTSQTEVGTGALRPPPGLTAGTPKTTVRTQIRLGQVAGYTGSLFFLPAPYWPMRLAVPSGWRVSADTLMVYSGEADHAGMSYTVTSGKVAETPALLSELSAPQNPPASIRKSYLGFDSTVTTQLRAIAQRIVRGKRTAYARAVALERYFQSGRFTYTLQTTVPPGTAPGVLTFLTADRRGYCQQFAFAMAVLARLVGIPARVVFGYTAGVQRPDGSWVVTTADGHSWPELYFDGVGWLRFEPTPGGADGQGTAVQPDYVTAAGANGRKGTQGSATGRNLPQTPKATAPSGLLGRRVKPLDGGAGPVQSAHRHGSTAPVGMIILAILAAVAVAPATARTVARRRRWHAAADDAGLARAAWQEMCADLYDFRLGARLSESPRAVARRVCASTGIDEPGRQAIGRIAAVVERARYAPVPEPAGAIHADVTQVRRSLAREATRAARWQAVLFPASTIGPLVAKTRRSIGLLTGWVPTSDDGTLS